MPGNWHAEFGKGLTEKGLGVPGRLPTSLDEGRPGEAVPNRAAYSTTLAVLPTQLDAAPEDGGYGAAIIDLRNVPAETRSKAVGRRRSLVTRLTVLRSIRTRTSCTSATAGVVSRTPACDCTPSTPPR